MATSHTASVIANSCVKPPVNPLTGLSSTVNERGFLTQSFSAEDLADDDDNDTENRPRSRQKSHRRSGSEKFRNNTGAKKRTTDKMIENLTHDLENLNDDDFYQRLIELKNEHKKTLAMCEQMYVEKLAAEQGIDEEQFYQSRSMNMGVSARDSIRDMSGKPPPARPVSANAGSKLRKSIRQEPSHSRHARSAWTAYSASEGSDFEQPVQNGILRRSTESLNALNESFNGNDVDRARGMRVRASSPMSRIDDMWDNFSVEDYAPATLPKSESESMVGVQKEEGWRHRITIPKPFSMTLREANKPKKTTAQTEFEKERVEKERQEELECQKKFKANPAPAHIYVPLYDEIMETQETQRRLNHALRGEMLRSVEKPFNFTQREEEKKRHQRTKSLTSEVTKSQMKKFTFKARPVPNTSDDSILDKVREEEEYRKIRMRMRAVEMLRKSNLPPSMDAREKSKHLTKSKKKMLAQTAKQLGIGTEPSFRPKINHEIPDFEEKHRKIMTDASRRKYETEATVMKPFKLRTSQIPSRKDKVYEDMRKDEEILRETRWPYTNPRAKPSPAHSTMERNSFSRSDSYSSLENILPPARPTTSQQLRESLTREKLSNMTDAELQTMKTKREKQLREKKLQKFVSEKAAANELQLTRSSEKERLKRMKEQERARLAEYREELKVIQQRVDSRPLLFERASQVNAKKAAEKRYQQTLKAAGIDEEFLRKQGDSYQGDDTYDLESDTGSYSPPPVDDGLSDGDRSLSGESEDEALEVA